MLELVLFNFSNSGKTYIGCLVLFFPCITFSCIGTNRPRFSSFQLTKEQKVVAFDNFGGSLGRYSYEDDTLAEHIQFSSFPNYERLSIPFKITITGYTMVQEGNYLLIKLGLGSKMDICVRP